MNAYVSSIDFVAIKIDPEEEISFEYARKDGEQHKKERSNAKPIDTSNVNRHDLMGRIRNHVLMNRIRVRRRG